MNFQGFLLWVIEGGGAGWVTYWLMEQIGKNLNLSADVKRYISLLLPIVLAVGAYWAGVGVGVTPAPATLVEGLDALVAIIVAIISSQAVHGFTRLRVKRV